MKSLHLLIATLIIIFLSLKLTAQDTVQVILKPNMPGLQIPSDFAGLSFEKYSINAKIFSLQKTSMINYFKTLGIHSLRIGGESVDQDTFSIVEPPYRSGILHYTKSELDSFFNFAKKANCKVLMGLNLGGYYNPLLASREVSYIMQHYASEVENFEVGNEPNGFHNSGFRPSTYSINNYEYEYLQYYDSILHYCPSASLSGPETSANYTKWTLPFCMNMHSKFSMLTEHYYVSRANIAPIPQQISILLSQSKLNSLLTEVKVLVQCAESFSVPFRITESNSFSNSGQWGVSDAFVSSIWALDYMYALASVGCAGINFHCGGSCPYTVIASTSNLLSARPIYYGILAFQVGSKGRFIPATITNKNINLNVYSVIDNSKTIFLTIVNKDTLQNALIQIQIENSEYTIANFITLSSNALTDTINVKLGGQTVSADGLCAEYNWQSLNMTANTIQVNVSAGSATIIRFK